MMTEPLLPLPLGGSIRLCGRMEQGFCACVVELVFLLTSTAEGSRRAALLADQAMRRINTSPPQRQGPRHASVCARIMEK